MLIASILSPLYTLFGWMLQELHHLLNNYGLTIIVFTILIRLILIPLNVKQHISTLKMQSLSPQIEDLKRIYGKDRMGMQQAQTELYKKHGISQLGGCLPSLLNLLLIWPIYRIFSAPLQYISHVTTENLQAIGDYLLNMGQLTQSQADGILSFDIYALQALQHHANSLYHVLQEGWLKLNQLIDLNFLGIDLGNVPSVSPAKLFGEESSIYLPLLIVPIVAVGTTFLSSKIMDWTNPVFKKMKEEKERAKLNPAKSVPSDATNSGIMKSMKYTMPIVTLITVLATPAAMGLYWIASNFMTIVQQLMLYYLYTRPYEKAKQEAKNGPMVD